jgi:hypothetical protein
MHALDLTAILTRIAGLSILAADTTFQTSITTLFGPHGTTIIAAIGLASVVATDVLRVIGSPTGSLLVIHSVSAAEPALQVPNFNDIPPTNPPKAS